MTINAILGSSPVNILTGTGKQFGVPLSLIALKDGVIDTSRLDAAVATAATPVLKALLASGAIMAGSAPAVVKAMTIKAKTPGDTGNSIALTFDNVTANAAAPGDSTADVAIVYEDRRTGLTPASIGAQLGTPTGGSAPGLVTLDAAATEVPAAMAPTKLAGTPLELAVPAADGSGDAFTLQAVGSDALLAELTVAIEDVTATSFTLVIAIDHQKTGVAIKNLASSFAPLIDVTPGSGGFAAPAEGVVTLSGGSDPQMSAPIAAEAVVLSG